VNLVFALDQGPHLYVERIAIHGNAATRDEVIRRDSISRKATPMDRALIDRAERRLRRWRCSSR